ncbi:MAG TPA: RpiB/LacA/LacB family sugar-phosphate isomerase [Candidatus Elarobacter sp.]|jgi:ribose 5-phosphate isomerase B
MRCAIGADAVGPLTDAILADLERRGITVERFGALRSARPLNDPDDGWASVGRAVGETVARGGADVGIVCCWTGTGISIAANKVRGVRAALCSDAATAAGARKWNDANVLALSLRATAPAVAAEILDAFLETGVSDDPADRREIDSAETP